LEWPSRKAYPLLRKLGGLGAVQFDSELAQFAMKASWTASSERLLSWQTERASR
jgi:hypothetical protein